MGRKNGNGSGRTKRPIYVDNKELKSIIPKIVDYKRSFSIKKLLRALREKYPDSNIAENYLEYQLSQLVETGFLCFDSKEKVYILH